MNSKEGDCIQNYSFNQDNSRMMLDHLNQQKNEQEVINILNVKYTELDIEKSTEQQNQQKFLSQNNLEKKNRKKKQKLRKSYTSNQELEEKHFKFQKQSTDQANSQSQTNSSSYLSQEDIQQMSIDKNGQSSIQRSKYKDQSLQYQNNSNYTSQQQSKKNIFRQKDYNLEYNQQSKSFQKIKSGKIYNSQPSQVQGNFKRMRKRQAMLFKDNLTLNQKANQTKLKQERFTTRFNKSKGGIDIDQLIKDCQKVDSLAEKIKNMQKLQKIKNVASNMILQTIENRRYKKMNDFHFKLINDASNALNKPTEGIMKFYWVQRVVSFLHLRDIDLFWPNNVYIVYWDLIIMMISIVTFFAFPVKIAFDYNYTDSTLSYIFLYQIPVIFIIGDIFVMLNRAYFKDGEIEDDRKNIAKNYIENHFITDILTISGLVINELFEFNFISFLIITRFVNIKRSYKKVFQEYYHFEGMYPIFSILFNLIMLICTVAHFCGCGFYFISNEFRNDKDTTTWIDTQELQESTNSEKYLEAVYFSFITMVTVGYGDVSPKNSREKLYCIVMTMVSCGVFAYAVNTIGQIISSLQQRSAQQKRDKYILVTYMRSKNINKNLQLRMLKYLDFKHQQVDKSAEQAQKILKQMIPKNLRDQFYEQYYGSLIKESPFFHLNFSKKLLISLSQCLCDKTFVSGEYLFKQNENCEYIYILLKGKVEIIYNRDHKQYAAGQISDNQVLGLENILTDTDYSYSARICQSSHIMFLKKQKFQEILQFYQCDQELFQEMKHKAIFNNSQIIKCQSCKGINHPQQYCPVVNYRPNKYILVGKHDQTRLNQRQRYFRAHNMKFSSYQDKMSMCLIVRCVRINLILELLQGYEIDLANIEQCLNEDLDDKQFFNLVPKYQIDKKGYDNSLSNNIIQLIKQNEKIEEEFLNHNSDYENSYGKQQSQNLQIINESFNENSQIFQSQSSNEVNDINESQSQINKEKNQSKIKQQKEKTENVSLLEEEDLIQVGQIKHIVQNQVTSNKQEEIETKKKKILEDDDNNNRNNIKRQIQQKNLNLQQNIQNNYRKESEKQNSEKQITEKTINSNQLISPTKKKNYFVGQKSLNLTSQKSINSGKMQDLQKTMFEVSQKMESNKRIEQSKTNNTLVSISKNQNKSNTLITQKQTSQINGYENNNNIRNQLSQNTIISKKIINQRQTSSLLSISDHLDQDQYNLVQNIQNGTTFSELESNQEIPPFQKKQKNQRKSVANIHDNLRRISKNISTQNGVYMHNKINNIQGRKSLMVDSLKQMRTNSLILEESEKKNGKKNPITQSFKQLNQQFQQNNNSQHKLEFHVQEEQNQGQEINIQNQEENIKKMSIQQNIYDFTLNKQLFDYDFDISYEFHNFFVHFNKENVIQNLQEPSSLNPFIILKKNDKQKKQRPLLQQDIKNAVTNKMAKVNFNKSNSKNNKKLSN